MYRQFLQSILAAAVVSSAGASFAAGTAAPAPPPSGSSSSNVSGGAVIVTNGTPGVPFSTNLPLPPNTTITPTPSNVPGVVVVGGGGVVVSSPGGIPLSQANLHGPTADASPSSGSTSVSAPAGSVGGSGYAGGVAPVRVEPQYQNDNLEIRGMALGATRRADIEGQLVDLYAVTQFNAAAPAMSRSSETISTVERVSAAPVQATAPGADVQVITSGLTPTPTQVGTVASVNPVAGGQSFGTYARPEAIRSTVSQTTVTTVQSSSTTTPENTTTIRSADGGIRMTISSPRIDSSRSSQELKNGVPAAIMVGNQAYVLVCDPRQLAAYAGQTVRISGTVNGAGMLVPDRFVVRSSDGAFRDIALNLPGGIRASDEGSRYATERE